MNWLDITTFVYADLVLVGGIYGYISSKSLPSIIAAAVAWLLICVGLLVARKFATPGYALCTFVAAANLVFFGMRLLKGHTMPAIPMVILSALCMGALVVGHFVATGAEK